MLLNKTTTIQAVVHEIPAWEDMSGLTLEEALQAAGRIKMGYESPLCRFGIVTEPSGKTHFLWLVHHAIYDGLGLGLILETLDKAYHGQDLPVVQPYSRFISYIMSIDKAAAAAYWRSQLHGARQAPFPPPSRVSQVDGTTDRTEVFKQIVPLVVQPTHGSGQASATQATILRAAWAIVLARYCDSDDVCFGTTISGRQAPVPGLEQVAGPMIATVPVRVRLGRRDDNGLPRSAKNFLHEVQSQALDMVAYEQFGLQNIAKLGRDAEDACNFSSLFLVQPSQMTAPPPSGAVTDEEEDDTLLSATELSATGLSLGVQNYFNYPLVIQAHLHEDSAELHFLYNSTVLAEPTMAAMAKHFGHVVQQLQGSALQATATNDILLESISVAGPWDFAQAMHLNRETPELCQTTIHELVERQALARPAAPAIDAWDATFTYGQLNDAAGRLASHLVTAYGVQVGDLVHVCFEKSAWYFVAILAINKAGAAWVPLEPSHPFERHQRVVQQTGGTLALASAGNVATCVSLVSTVLLVSRSLDDELAAHPSTAMTVSSSPVNINNRARAGPTDVAYVLFTSGSTGTPKGFVMEHGAVCTSQTAISKRLGLEADKVRILNFASYVFDLSIGEIVAPLISGACICVPSEETRLSGLVEYMNEARVNWAFLTPSFARTLDPRHIPRLELLLLAGEAVGKDVFNQWFGRVRLINGWGPAETCVFSTLHEWTSADESPLTVGRPVGGYCWLVNPEDHSLLAPIGCLGEVLIQGPTLLREYIADRERTDTTILRSLPDWAPMRSSPSWQRFYKSGDICFINSWGFIEFSDRKDDQVKIRGLRVELGEVEQATRSALPDVKVAVDVHRTENSTSLVAFLCFSAKPHTRKSDEMPHAPRNPDDQEDLFLPITAELRDDIHAAIGKLGISLPRYMIPALYIPCRTIPLITSTKVDRAGLRTKVAKLLANSEAWDMYALQSSTKRKPQTPMEHRMQRLWADVLQKDVDSIGRDDSFLGIGGDSILSIRLVAKARGEGLRLTAGSIFEDPRLLAVAAKAQDVKGDYSADATVLSPFSLLSDPIRKFVVDPTASVEGQTIRDMCQLLPDHVIEDAYPCTPLQEGLMSLTVKQPGSYTLKVWIACRKSGGFKNSKLNHTNLLYSTTTSLQSMSTKNASSWRGSGP